MRLLRLFPPPYPSTLLFLNLFPCLGDLRKVGTEVFNWYAIPYLAADLLLKPIDRFLRPLARRSIHPKFSWWSIRTRANRVSIIINKARFDALKDFLKGVSGFGHGVKTVLTVATSFASTLLKVHELTLIA